MSKQASDQEQANLVRSEQSDQSVRIEGESMAFAPDSLDSIPKLHVPGLSPDATSLPPEALRGEVPTLTDPVLPEAAAPAELPEARAVTVPESQPEPVLALEPVVEVEPEVGEVEADRQVQEESAEEAAEAPPQEPVPEADTWVEQMQVRIERLTDEIHLLNDRLDRFEKLPKV